jgi:hypothetical protein
MGWILPNRRPLVTPAEPTPDGFAIAEDSAVGASSPQAGSRSDSIYECLPLQCPSCGQPMRMIAFILEPPVIERILGHIGEPVAPPVILPARSPPQAEMDFDQTAGRMVRPVGRCDRDGVISGDMRHKSLVFGGERGGAGGDGPSTGREVW